MRDSKSLLLISISLLLFVISFVILCSWGYNFYYKIKDDKQALKPDNNPVVLPLVTKDSLQKMYASAVSTLDTMLNTTLKNADSLTGGLSTRLDEFTRLRNEITELLKNPASSKNTEAARQKIGELQQRVTALRSRNIDVEAENRKLYAALQQLSTEKIPVEQNARPASFESKVVPDAPRPSTSFAASDLQLSAVVTNDNNDEETAYAGDAEKFVGSFTVRNNHAANRNTEMTIVIIQPDGQVLRSGWESGMFSTPKGNKPYSCRVHFEYNSGESKRVFFSVSAEKYLKGNYTMQVYHNGVIIGKVFKSLS